MRVADNTAKTDPEVATVRFAPSPNGLLHLGHARSALLNWRFAKQSGARFLLRIEDIDIIRARPEFEQAIFEDLAWLGLDWPEPVRRQSDHFDDYRAALAELRKLGLIYPAFMSRAEVASHVRAYEQNGRTWPRDPDGAPHYPDLDQGLAEAERNRRIDAGDPHSWRLNMQAALDCLTSQEGGVARLTWQEDGHGPDGETGEIVADPGAWGDVVLARRDVPASYHIAVTVDDALQAITTVIRGQDLFASTSVHRLLQSLLRLPAPIYRHHSLVLDSSGRKLSKSDGDIALAELRAKGLSPAEVIAMADLEVEE
jgi:glutamyl-Q tRNA(Asp) synthetase